LRYEKNYSLRKVKGTLGRGKKEIQQMKDKFRRLCFGGNQKKFWGSLQQQKVGEMMYRTKVRLTKKQVSEENMGPSKVCFKKCSQ